MLFIVWCKPLLVLLTKTYAKHMTKTYDQNICTTHYKYAFLGTLYCNLSPILHTWIPGCNVWLQRVFLTTSAYGLQGHHSTKSHTVPFSLNILTWVAQVSIQQHTQAHIGLPCRHIYILCRATHATVNQSVNTILYDLIGWNHYPSCNQPDAAIKTAVLWFLENWVLIHKQSILRYTGRLCIRITPKKSYMRHCNTLSKVYEYIITTFEKECDRNYWSLSVEAICYRYNRELSFHVHTW